MNRFRPALFPSHRRRAFSLAAWGMCLLILAGLCLLSAPLVHEKAQETNARLCRRELARIMAAKTQYALDNQLDPGAEVDMQTLIETENILESKPVCPAAGIYSVNPIGQDPTCSCGGLHTITPQSRNLETQPTAAP